MQKKKRIKFLWIPAYAGMTGKRRDDSSAADKRKYRSLLLAKTQRMTGNSAGMTCLRRKDRETQEGQGNAGMTGKRRDDNIYRKDTYIVNIT